MLEGVVTRGTARSLSYMGSYVAGKTGTTDNENDAWFASFTKDVTVVVWVGYDNSSGRRTLGSNGTGGHTAAPIAEEIIKATWNEYPKVPLPPPSPQVARQVKAIAMGRGEARYTEYFRLNGKGRVVENKNTRLSRRNADDDDVPSGSVRQPERQTSQSPAVQEQRTRSQLAPFQFGAPPWWGSFGGNTNAGPRSNSVPRRQEDRY
jgi:membrane carboxypeptidase/penicillin-binding protein